MKRICFFTLLLLSFFSLEAQNVSIELSIEWKKGLDITIEELSSKNISPAYLHITYRNLSEKSLYFQRVSANDKGLPELPYTVMKNYMGKHPTFCESFADYLHSSIDYYLDDNFIVSIGNSAMSFSNGWFVQNATIDDKSHTMLAVNSYLADIYNCLYEQNYSKYRPFKTRADGSLQMGHDSLDITQDTITGNSIDEFVYLKPGEIYIDTYNLIGFQIIGGNYTFKLSNKNSSSYVWVGMEKNELEQKWVPIHQPLPKNVGEYELFTGDFLINTVSVQFEGIRTETD